MALTLTFGRVLHTLTQISPPETSLTVPNRTDAELDEQCRTLNEAKYPEGQQQRSTEVFDLVEAPRNRSRAAHFRVVCHLQESAYQADSMRESRLQTRRHPDRHHYEATQGPKRMDIHLPS